MIALDDRTPAAAFERCGLVVVNAFERAPARFGFSKAFNK
jgi:hypothetical protein